MSTPIEAQWITVMEAAKRLDKTRKTIYEWIEKGRLKKREGANGVEVLLDESLGVEEAPSPKVVTLEKPLVVKQSKDLQAMLKDLDVLTRDIYGLAEDLGDGYQGLVKELVDKTHRLAQIEVECLRLKRGGRGV